MTTIQHILNVLLNRLLSHETACRGDITDVLYDVCSNRDNSLVVEFALDEHAANIAMTQEEQKLKEICPSYKVLSQSISYLLDELICNIQQHSGAEKGLLCAQYDSENQLIEIVLADHGISIYGSYVRAEKYLNLIGNSDAQALGLAKDGYSTKNLPNAENRGYGISSNTKMVTKGLKGEIAIYSGTALFVQTPQDVKLLELPESLDIQGTVVFVRIPIRVPDNYDFYEYIS